MTFPNACNGIKKIYKAELIALATEAFLLISSFGLIVSGGDILGKLGIFALAGVFTVIAMLAAFIINLIGIHAAAADEPLFRLVMICTFTFIGATLLSGVFKAGSFLAIFFSFAGNVFSAIISLLIIQGIIRLSERLESLIMAGQGRRIQRLVGFTGILGVIAKLIADIVKSKNGYTAAGLVAVAASMVSIVSAVLYLGYLKRAKVMLES